MHSNLSSVAWNTSSLLNNLSQSFYSVSVGNASACAWNMSAQLNNLSLSYWNISHSNLSTVAWNTSTQLSNLSTTCVSINTSLINVSNIINNISLVNLSTNYWKTNASLSTVLSNYLTTQPVSISTANACIMNLSCTSIASRGNCTMTGNGLVYFNANSNTLATTYIVNRLVWYQDEQRTTCIQCAIRANAFNSSCAFLCCSSRRELHIDAVK